jgi:hypothetical protein
MTNPNLTALALIVDRSGSMQYIAGDMNGAIHNLLVEQAKEPGDLFVNVTTFDDQVEHPVVAEHVRDLVRAGRVDYIQPRGMTALHDAIGRTVTELGQVLAATEEDQRPSKVIVVVVTDGGENSSREYTRGQIRTLVTQQEEQWGWTFLYLAANVDAFGTGQHMGFAKGGTIAYAANSVGTQSVYAAASAAVTRSRQGGSAEFTDEERAAAQ